MSITTLNLTKIGNGQGVRLSKTLLSKFDWTTEILAEELPEGLLLRRSMPGKLSWDDTFKAMAKSSQDWTEWNVTAADGL